MVGAWIQADRGAEPPLAGASVNCSKFRSHVKATQRLGHATLDQMSMPTT
jgi:hypothetical protein